MFPPASRILIVDDAEVSRSLIKTHLLTLGLKNVEEAENGQKALEIVNQEVKSGSNFDLIISDWIMPGMSGFELFNQLRSNPKTQAIPFLMITAESDSEQVMKALSAGVNEYIVKPFTYKTILDKLGLIWRRLSKV